MERRELCFFVIAAVTVALPEAAADPVRTCDEINVASFTEQQARQLAGDYVNRGIAAIERKGYFVTVDCYAKAYEVAPDPRVLYGLGDVYRTMGKSRMSAYFLSRYLAADPKGKYARTSQKLIKELNLSLKELEQHGRRVSVQGEMCTVEPASATAEQNIEVMLIDDALQQALIELMKEKGRQAVSPHLERYLTLDATGAEAPDSEAARFASLCALLIAIRLPPVEEAAPTPLPSAQPAKQPFVVANPDLKRSEELKRAGLVFGGVGIALLGVGIGVRNTYGKLFSLGLGGAGTVAGAVFYLRGYRLGNRQHKTAVLQPVLLPDSIGVVIEGSF